MVRHPITYERLIAFAAGELEAGESEAVARHVTGCAQCRATVKWYVTCQSLRGLADSPEPPAEWVARAQAIYQPFGGRHSGRGQQPPAEWVARAQAIYRPSTAMHSGQRPTLTGGALLPRWAVVAVLLLCLVVAAGGTRVLAAAAESALPGDVLYPLKIAGENVQLALTFDRRGQVLQHLASARAREQEIAALVSLGRYDKVPETSRADQEQIRQSVQLLGQMAQQDSAGAVALAPQVDQALSAHIDMLNGLLSAVPAADRPGLQDALAAAQDGQSQVDGIIAAPPVTATPPGVGPARATEVALTPNPSRGDQTPGPNNTPPGLSNTPPGQNNTPPGLINTPPGQINTPPGQNNTPPGQINTPPGQNNTPPGQSKTPPGPPAATRTPPGGNGGPQGTPRADPQPTKVPPVQTRTPPGRNQTPAPDTQSGR